MFSLDSSYLQMRQPAAQDGTLSVIKKNTLGGPSLTSVRVSGAKYGASSSAAAAARPTGSSLVISGRTFSSTSERSARFTVAPAQHGGRGTRGKSAAEIAACAALP